MKILPHRGWLRPGPAEYPAFLRKDSERWARVIKISGVKAE